jgi:hypothetical protein
LLPPLSLLKKAPLTKLLPFRLTLFLLLQKNLLKKAQTKLKLLSSRLLKMYAAEICGVFFYP